MDCFNMEGKGKVHAVAEEIRQLNGLDEKALHVRWGSYNDIIYEGNHRKLILPAGYYCSTYNEGGRTIPCITNKGNTGDNSYWSFAMCQK